MGIEGNDRSGGPGVQYAVATALERHEQGDDRRARELLGPVVDDPARWAEVAGHGFDVVEVAYVAGITRLAGGDVEGASRALRLGLGGGGEWADRVRRALAQVELSRGELDAAEQLLDSGPKAVLMDQALVATLRWRQGHTDDAVRRAAAIVHGKPRRQLRREHPWTVGGSLVQCGLVLAEAGDVRTLLQAIERTLELIRGAPIDLPLRWQWCILLASARRQEENLDEAAEVLGQAAGHLDPDTSDLGVLQLEQARLARAQYDTAGAASSYALAIATFDAAGERWHATQARAEATSG